MTPYPVAAAGRNTHCAICGRPLSFHQQWSGDICDDWRCRWAKLDRGMQVHRQEAARAIGEARPEVYRVVVVPHRLGSINTLPHNRRSAHLEFLNELVTKVTQDGRCAGEPCIEQEGPDGRPPAALTAAVCAVCAGACCHRAGDRAFLNTVAIDRFMAANDAMQPAHIISTYVAHLPERSFKDSCVYHTLGGCALPRSLRADVCNSYRCSGLKQAEQWARSDGTTRIYVVVRKDNRIRRAAFVHSGGIRHYPPTDAQPGSGGSPYRRLSAFNSIHKPPRPVGMRI